MNSMTGFGKSDSQSKDFSLDVTVRSVNGRFLDSKVHSPKAYSSFEIEIRKRISKKILRGTVEIFINRKAFAGTEKIVFNEKLAEKWWAGFSKIAKKMKLLQTQDSRVLLNIPDFYKVDDSYSVSSKEKAELIKVIDGALEACAQLRKKEGLGLKKDLIGYVGQLKKNLLKIQKLRKVSEPEIEKRYRARLERLGFPGEVDPQRLAQEIIIQIDKSDISEEVQRLSAHIDAVKKLLSQKGSIGKKLDFYAQEFLREVNTMGAKSPSAKLTEVVVESKAVVEKFREQVQNVE